MPYDQLLYFHIIQQLKLMMATSLSSCYSLSSQFKVSPRYWGRLTPIQLLQFHITWGTKHWQLFFYGWSSWTQNEGKIKVLLTPQNFFSHMGSLTTALIIFGPGFFLQMLYLFKVIRKLPVGVLFLALGQNRRMDLVFFVISSQCIICTKNKQTERHSFLLQQNAWFVWLFLHATRKVTQKLA